MSPENDSLDRARQFRRSVLEDSGSDIENRHSLLSEEQALSFLKESGGNEFSKYFFGLPMVQAIALGYKISRQCFFETSHSPAVITTARTIKRILAEIGYAGEQAVADVCMGTAHYSWGFAGEGFKVDATEKDTFTFEYAKHNLRLAGVDNRVRAENTDALSSIERARSAKRQYAAVFLDPPWNNTYDFNLAKNFRLEHTEPSLDMLVTVSNPLAPVVFFKAPPTLDVEQAVGLGRVLGCGALVQYQHMRSYVSGKLRQIIMVYFIEGSNGHTTEYIEVAS